jgi:hypothetical protein
MCKLRACRFVFVSETMILNTVKATLLLAQLVHA